MSLGYAKQLNRLEAEIKELKAQRDELLEALEDLATLVDNDADAWQIYKNLENAMNAIAKAKGE